MFFLKSKKDKNEESKPVLVFDFGSQSVKILSCNYFGDHVEVLAGKKVSYPQGVRTEEGFVAEELARVLKDAIFSMKDGKVSAQRGSLPVRLPAGKAGQAGAYAVVGIGGLGVEGYTSQINYRRALKGKVIEEPEFRSILAKVEDRANQIMKKMIAWETASEEEALINSEVLDLSLDGYSVASPVGSKGEKISFVIYNGYVKRKLLDSIIRAIKLLGLQSVSISSTMYSTLRSVLESIGIAGSFLVLDIGGSLTEVGIVSEGRILGHTSFEVAANSFTRSISAELNYRMEEAELLKLGFSGGKMDDDMMKDIREIISADCKVFLSGVELVLKEFPGLAAPPNQAFLIGGGSLLQGVVSCIQASENNGFLRAGLYTTQDMRGFVDLTKRLNSPADVPTLSVALDAVDLVGEVGSYKSFWGELLKK